MIKTSNCAANFVLFAFIFFYSTTVLFAQNAELGGTVQDSLGNPLMNTNVIASPQTGNEQIRFAITGKNGGFDLLLQENIPYKIEVTSLGFAPLIDSLKINKDTVKNYVLYESTEQLNEVVVEAKMAMVVKEDTITYRTDKFKQGDERKLRDVLKRLPGVEVDREGNVKVNGKKVTTLMVDGHDFFGGDTKLGVNNIPADAVDEVEAIDDYNEVAFMKGLNDSDKMAMNIKLKKDKKNFVFGENQVGGGIKERYHVKPTLFYYSPETTVNFIGSLNNVNESPLDWRDVTRFKGGYSNIMDSPVNSGSAGLTQFSSDSDIKRRKTVFGAANLNQKINDHLRLEAYSLVAQQKSIAESLQDKEYLTGNNLNENRRTNSQDKGFSNFNKVRLRYKPTNTQDLAYDFVANVSNSSFDKSIISNSNNDLNTTETASNPHNLEISQYFRYNTQPSYEHTSVIKASYTYKKAHNLTDWNFDRPVFPDIIPVEQNENGFNFLERYYSVTNSGQFDFKHFWVLDNTNHIYPKAGMNFYDQAYKTEDFQRLQNNEVNNFSGAGFNNDIAYQLIDPYVGFEYKMKLGDFILRPGLVYHHYFWNVKQFSKSITEENKGVLLPEFKIEFEPTSTKTLKFNYYRKSSFAGAEKYANRLRLQSFNLLYRGNENLENSIYHSFSLNFREINRAKGLIYNIGTSYNHREKSVRNATRIEGINQVTTSVYTDFPENTYRANSGVTKRWNFISAGFSGRLVLSDYSRLINDQKIDYSRKNYGYKIQGRTRFEDWPNVTLSFQQILKSTTSDRNTNNYYSLDPRFELDYSFLNGFILKADYNYSYTKNTSNGQEQDFKIGNASLYYSAEKSPWGFELRANNVFDIKFKRSYYVNDFIVSDTRTFIQPRTVLFLLSYQL